MRLDMARYVSDEELLLLAQRNPGYRFERTAEGILVVTPTGGRSGRRNAVLLAQVFRWNEQTRKGVVFDSSTGFRLPDGSVFSPDCSWVRSERWNALAAEDQEGLVPLCPDAVFELRSQSDSIAELRQKMLAYRANGAVVGVLIDPYSRIVEVYRHGKEVEVLMEPNRVSLEPELPEFVLNLELIFTS